MCSAMLYRDMYEFVIADGRLPVDDVLHRYMYAMDLYRLSRDSIMSISFSHLRCVLLKYGCAHICVS